MAESSLRCAALAAALLLAACATVTPYQPERGGYGYGEQVLEVDRVRIHFAGSEATPRDTVQDYLLYRAAELTLQRGGEHFVITESSMIAQDGSRPNVGIGLGGFRFGGSGGISVGVGTSTGGATVAWRAEAEIVIRPGAKPADNPQAFNARELLTNLAPRIQRP